MLGLFILGLAFALIALVSGNNLSACTGAIIGGKITSKKTGIAIAILGFILGLILEGAFLKKGVETILPVKNELLIAGVFSIAILVFLLADKTRVPLSLTISFTSMLIGLSVGMGAPINWYFILLIFAFWIFMPLLSLFSLPGLMSYFTKRLKKGSIWNKVAAMKVLLIIISLFTSFTLGANTIGLIYASVPYGNELAKEAVAIAAILVGSIFLSEGELERIGNEIVPLRYLNALLSQLVSSIEVEVATLFGVPLSNTQTFTASLYGIGYGYKARLMRRRPAYAIISVWTLSAALSFLLAFLLTKL
ncbi:MAG: inorganic phosphate transporter [Candidatus Micrarchaeia archaeon]